MNISDKGLDFIKNFEGFKCRPYKCLGGYWTIGYGHVLFGNIDPTIKITKEEAHKILEKDLENSKCSVSRNIKVPINQNQIDSLISFTFNLGGGALQRSTLRQKINYDLYAKDQITNEFLKWSKCNGRTIPGLLRRRVSEAKLFFD